MYALQIQNVKRNVVKKVSIDKLNNPVQELEEERKNESEVPEISQNTTSISSTSTGINDLPTNQIEPFIETKTPFASSSI